MATQNGVPSSEVKTAAQVNKIPQSLGTGKISEDWLPFMSSYVQATAPASPEMFDLWSDTTENQVKIWDGTIWRTFA